MARELGRTDAASQHGAFVIAGLGVTVLRGGEELLVYTAGGGPRAAVAEVPDIGHWVLRVTSPVTHSA